MIDTSISSIISAYGKAAHAAGGAPASDGQDAEATQGDDFGSLVKAGLQAAVDASKKSETLSKQAIAGKADIREVVTAVNNAELTLQTVVAVRDKVVSAYNDIMRMSF